MISFDSIAVNFSNMGLFYTDQPWIHPKRIINTYELIYCIEGSFQIIENEINYHLEPGSLLILYPHMMHAGVRKTDKLVKFYWLHFYCNDFEKLNLKKQYKINETEIDSFIFNELNSLQTQEGKKLLQDVKLLEILLKMGYKQQQDSRKIFNDIKEYIRLNANKSINVESIAESFHYSAGHLSRIFKKTIGLPLRNYIINTRIHYIKNLLLNSGASIKEISALCDFYDENIFVKFFKHNTGITPTQYRNKHGNAHTNNH